MIATAFDEENSVFGPPPGVSLDYCSVLSTWKGKLSDGQPAVISCWKPTVEEWEEMRRTGRIWIIVMGEGMPPIAPTGLSPFTPAPVT